MDPPASNRVSRVRSYSGVTSLASIFVYGDFTLFVSTFQLYSTDFHSLCCDPQPHIHVCGLASFPFARRYLGNRCFFLFLRVLRCFSSPRYLYISYVFTYECLHITTGGFPHSEICGLSDICSYPQLIAACHVLLRLPVPRHPPYALSYLTFFKFTYR